MVGGWFTLFPIMPPASPNPLPPLVPMAVAEGGVQLLSPVSWSLSLAMNGPTRGDESSLGREQGRARELSSSLRGSETAVALCSSQSEIGRRATKSRRAR